MGCFLPPPIPAISLLLRSDYSFTASVNLLTFYPQAWDIFWNKDKIFLVARGYQSQNIFLCIKSCRENWWPCFLSISVLHFSHLLHWWKIVQDKNSVCPTSFWKSVEWKEMSFRVDMFDSDPCVGLILVRWSHLDVSFEVNKWSLAAGI